ncbi:MAG: class I SAM-dependent methyltransferase [Thermoleophilaceae bacterium]
MTAGLGRRYAKLCDRRDFDDPELLAALREILPERDPSEHIERKVWEFAMLALFLREAGRLDDRSEALAIGAGDERMVFWLANRMGRVVATDIYGSGGFSEREARSSMLEDPAAHAPFPYREDRLEVRWMDARELDFPDESFDVVFSLSSIEHFGPPAEIARSAREMGRVLRPGGHAFVATECFVHRDLLNSALVDLAVRALTLGRKRRIATPRRRAVVSEVFTPRELMQRVVAPSGLELMQPLDLSLSPQTWDNLTTSLPGGSLEPASGEFYPHLLLRSDRSVFTSACLPLLKPRPA